jgi:hypothetical protein
MEKTKKSSKSKIKKKSKKINSDDNIDDNNDHEKDVNDFKILSKKVLKIQKYNIINTTKLFIANDGVVALSSVY